MILCYSSFLSSRFNKAKEEKWTFCRKNCPDLVEVGGTDPSLGRRAEGADLKAAHGTEDPALVDRIFGRRIARRAACSNKKQTGKEIKTIIC